MEEQKISAQAAGEAERASVMKRIEASNAEQERYAKKQYTMSLISAISNVLVLAIVIFVVITMIPKVNATFEDLNVIMTNMQSITDELASVDIGGMAGDVRKLVNGSSDSLSQAMKKLNAIDVEKLNEAIQNLSDAIEPMARFANLFK